ncbi:CYTH domain-containing protein [Salinicola halimionae]|uniref:CYTH domain-containing protein n=1 Tax=Salinicola halimionae TaxID=1949081 RepID=UPI000DA1AB00|nr:CYTH domain-containing protein [Salinicola halimionae]
MSEEIELKLALSPQGPEHLGHHPLLQTLASQTVALGNQYYDTPAAVLQSQRVALRVRRLGDNRLQTLKSAAESRGGLSNRGEWEWSIDDADCNAAGLDLPGLRALNHPALAEVDLEALSPVFTTDFERRLWRYQVDDSDIEIALDQGTIHAGGASLPILELELELKQGRPEQLWQLAETLCAAGNPGRGMLPARPANHSKASRAARLSHGWPEPSPRQEPSSGSETSVDVLIDAIDNWQDSHDPAWLVEAKALCEQLVRRWKAEWDVADRASGPSDLAKDRALANERILAGERILARLSQDTIPWCSQDWLTLRRQDPSVPDR